ncbi:MAG: acyl-CoA thioesterase [Oligoflexia bacterium]|nr:acyl-CoA thioesterase [Oligoflexia bacterium]
MSVSDEVIMTEIVLPSHANTLGTVFGGVIMSWIDIAGAIAAQRHCRQTVVTASIDDLAFIAAVKQGWFVQIRARVNFTSRTSMEVGVRVDAENPKTGEWHHTSSAYLTFVAIDESGKPAPVPALEPKSEEEQRRFNEAIKRRELRLKIRGQKKY